MPINKPYRSVDFNDERKWKYINPLDDILQVGLQKAIGYDWSSEIDMKELEKSLKEEGKSTFVENNQIINHPILWVGDQLMIQSILDKHEKFLTEINWPIIADIFFDKIVKTDIKHEGNKKLYHIICELFNSWCLWCEKCINKTINGKHYFLSENPSEENYMKFTEQQIQNIKTVIVHDNCADGLASAMILHHCLPKAEVRFLTYGQKEYQELIPEEGMLFCDIVPPKEKWKEFLEIGSIVLDHHKGAENIVKEFVEFNQGIFADEKLDKGVSGAVLAFNFWKNVISQRESDYDDEYFHFQELSALVGIRDTWQKDLKDFDKASAISAALLFYSREEMMSLKDGQYDGLLNSLENFGITILKQRRNKAVQLIKQGYRFEIKNARILIVESEQEKLTSDVADLVEDIDIIVGFKYLIENDIGKLCLSFRSKDDYGVMELAQKLGGNGHQKASGATIDFTKDNLCLYNPYTTIEILLKKYL